MAYERAYVPLLTRDDLVHVSEKLCKQCNETTPCTFHRVLSLPEAPETVRHNGHVHALYAALELSKLLDDATLEDVVLARITGLLEDYLPRPLPVEKELAASLKEKLMWIAARRPADSEAYVKLLRAVARMYSAVERF